MSMSMSMSMTSASSWYQALRDVVASLFAPRVGYTYTYTIVACVVGGFALFAWRWGRTLSRRAEELAAKAPFLAMKRNRQKTTQEKARQGKGQGQGHRQERSRLASQLDVSESYKEYLANNYPDIQVMSLGEYLDSLEPASVVNKITPQEELDIMLAAAMMRVVGPTIGGALFSAAHLAMPTTAVTSALRSVAASATAAAATKTARKSIQRLTKRISVFNNDNNNNNTNENENHKHNQNSNEDEGVLAAASRALPAHAVGGLTGLSLFSVLGAADVAATLSKKAATAEHSNASSYSSSSSNSNSYGTNESEGERKLEGENDGERSTMLTMLTMGELDKPSFPSEVLPNPFVLSEHWEKAIFAMEEEIRKTNPHYESHIHPVTHPSPVKEFMLPDLHIGPGLVPKTHTNREILQNRLISILLNRLGANYIREEIPTDPLRVDSNKPFSVQLDATSKTIMYPSEFIEALGKAGYTIQAKTSCRTTTFGFGLSVKDTDPDDGSVRWIHIPLAIPLRSGIPAPDGTPVPAYLTHSSTGLSISGPLMQNVLVECYHSQDGYAGWITGHYTNLPWMFDEISVDLDPVRAVEVCTLLSVCINSVAMDMQLTIGGYGQLGVCNDSAAAVDATVRGTTDIYPLVHIGYYYYHVIKRCQKLLDSLQTRADVPSRAVDEAKQLYRALMDAPNDIHPTPKLFPETARRIICSMPKHPYLVEMEKAIANLEPFIG